VIAVELQYQRNTPWMRLAAIFAEHLRCSFFKNEQPQMSFEFFDFVLSLEISVTRLF